MKTIIFCGGRGIRLYNESSYIPKAMVKIGHRPIIWHIMKRYSFSGYNDFILALGLNGEYIRDYFTKYEYYSNDIKVTLGKKQNVEILTKHQEDGWKITLVDTGDTAMTGARIQRCKQYVTEDNFMVTYSDCLADLDIKKLIEFHKKTKKIATVTGIASPYREGEFYVRDNLAVDLYKTNQSKTHNDKTYINGGYMVFTKDIFPYLKSFNECKLETEVFARLVTDNQLAVFPHQGFWRWLDTDRDFSYLNNLADKNKMYWLYDQTTVSLKI